MGAAGGNDLDAVEASSDVTPEGALAPPPEPAPASSESRELDNLVVLSSDLVCGGCGYQIAAYTTPPECPMCRERNWQPIATTSTLDL